MPGQLSKEEIQRAVLSKAALIEPFIVPILHYLIGESDPAKWKHGGTGLLLDTGTAKLLVTAKHVMEKTFGELGEQQFVTLIGGDGFEPFNISNWKLFGSGSKLDLCTVLIPDSFDPTLIGKKLCRPSAWPAERAKKGDHALIVGYPQAHRNGSGDSLICRKAVVLENVASVSERHFILYKEDDTQVISVLEAGLQVPDHLGGISGAPIFALRPDGRLEPIGVEYEGGSAEGPFFGLHFDFVAATGEIVERDFR